METDVVGAKEVFPLLVVDVGTWQLDFTQVTIIPPDAMPSAYHRLLVHHHHMTVTLEDHYQDHLNVEVLSVRREDQSYHREIVLRTQKQNRIVQFGVVRIDLNCCSQSVQKAILAENTPLGRVLIEHNVLRRIEPTAFLKIAPGKKLMNWMELDRDMFLYGRMGVIFCDERPAIAVLEILAPLETIS